MVHRCLLISHNVDLRIDILWNYVTRWHYAQIWLNVCVKSFYIVSALLLNSHEKEKGLPFVLLTYSKWRSSISPKLSGTTPRRLLFCKSLHIEEKKKTKKGKKKGEYKINIIFWIYVLALRQKKILLFILPVL